MNLSELALRDITWLKPPPSSDSSIISTRIRLARNLRGCPMPGTASSSELKKLLNEIFSAAQKNSFFKNSTKIKLSECSEIDLSLLMERHLISHEHAVSSHSGGVIIDGREQMSIMINEEDHLRIQYISAGLNLFDSWEVINTADDELGKSLDFAYSEKFGYLTACPTNTGTGMRASCQMHLPALGISGVINSTMESINKMGMVVRGLQGEGTRIMGDMLQVSNQVTLGLSEQRILDNLQRLLKQVSQRENKIRKKLMETDSDSIKDRVYRSQGLLLNAYKISYTEALSLISSLRFGVYMDMLEYDVGRLNNLMVKILPAHIQQIEKKLMEPEERDRVRADMIRKELNAK